MENLELTLKIKNVLVPEVGTSKTTGKEWRKTTAVFETMDSYPKTVAVEFWGDNGNWLANVQPDTILNVAIKPESREFNGRYFTSLKCVGIAPLQQYHDARQAPQAVRQYQQPQQPVALQNVQDFFDAMGSQQERLPF